MLAMALFYFFTSLRRSLLILIQRNFFMTSSLIQLLEKDFRRQREICSKRMSENLNFKIMTVLTDPTNRRDALQQLLALTLGGSLLGLSSCTDEKTAESLSQVAATKKEVIPCKP